MGDKRTYRYSSPLLLWGNKSKIVGGLLVVAAAAAATLMIISAGRKSTPQQDFIQRHSSSSTSQSSSEEQQFSITSKTDPSFEIFLFPPEKDIISKKIFESGVYEPEETEFIRQVATTFEGGWAVDIGANVGFHTLHMGVLGLQVICMEPSPDTASLLRQSIEANSNNQRQGTIHLIEAAAAEEPGTGRLVRHPDSPGMTILTRIGDDTSKLPFGVVTVLDADITLVRPESIISKYMSTDMDTQTLRLLKIDAEGHELHAFKGVNLERFPFSFIAFELFPELLWKAGQTDPLDLLLYLHQFRYACTNKPMSLFYNKGKDLKLPTEEQVRTQYRETVQTKYEKSDKFHENIFCKKV